MKKIDIQSIQVSMYPKKTNIHVSKYPCIQISMICKYPPIQVSKKIQYPRYPSIRISEKSGIHSSLIATGVWVEPLLTSCFFPGFPLASEGSSVAFLLSFLSFGPKSGIHRIFDSFFIFVKKKKLKNLFHCVQHSMKQKMRPTAKAVGSRLLERPLMHTVSFNWFLSGLWWIISLQFCLLKLLIFYQKLLYNIRSRLNFSTFWVFESVSKSSFFLFKKLQFWSNISKFSLKNSKCGRVKPRSDIP